MSYDQHFKKLKSKKAAPNAAEVPKSSKAVRTEKAKGSGKVQKPRKRAETPWSLFVVLLVATSGAFLGYQNLDQVDGFISKVEIGFLGQASAEEGNITTEGPIAEKPAGPDASAKSVECAPVTTPNEEELSHYSKLAERKQQLDLREQELSRMEEELQKQKDEIEVRIEKLEKVRAEISGVLREKVEVDEQRVATLVDFYSNMKPKQAAEIFNKLNEDLAVEVLGRMKKKSAAEIMNLLEPAKARVLSEKFTGYKRR